MNGLKRIILRKSGWPPLRQLKLAAFQVPFRLESPGFSGKNINKKGLKQCCVT